MPERNRVTPYGDIQAFALRGALTGNRGVLHRGHEIVRFHAHDAWVTCALKFKDRWREQWLPNRFTWLYFQDEAVALAAGHRPCAECRWQSYVQYRDAWRRATGARPTAQQMNRQLHVERLVPRTHTRRAHEAAFTTLPDGTFVDIAGSPWLIADGRIVEWTPDGYGIRRPRPAAGNATVITPASSVAVLRQGYPIQIDASALR